MKTATDAISIIQELPPEERQKVKKFLLTDDDFLEEDYSPEDIEKILQTVKEAEQGINMTPPMDASDAVDYLKSLMK